MDDKLHYIITAKAKKAREAEAALSAAASRVQARTHAEIRAQYEYEYICHHGRLPRKNSADRAILDALIWQAVQDEIMREGKLLDSILQAQKESGF